MRVYDREMCNGKYRYYDLSVRVIGERTSRTRGVNFFKTSFGTRVLDVPERFHSIGLIFNGRGAIPWDVPVPSAWQGDERRVA